MKLKALMIAAGCAMSLVASAANPPYMEIEDFYAVYKLKADGPEQVAILSILECPVENWAEDGYRFAVLEITAWGHNESACYKFMDGKGRAEEDVDVVRVCPLEPRLPQTKGCKYGLMRNLINHKK